MAADRKMKNPKPRLIHVEKEEYDKFMENLPRRKSFDEAIREYMESVNLEAQKTKNLSSPNYSAVSNNIYNEDEEINKHTCSTLDIYLLSKDDIRNYIDQIEDIQTLADIEEKGKVFYKVAQTKKREILPLQKLKNELNQKNKLFK